MFNVPTADDFEQIGTLWERLNRGHECLFTLVLRAKSLCALRLKQEDQADTPLPMNPRLEAITEESFVGTLCTCQAGPDDDCNHVDRFQQSPDDMYLDRDAFREFTERQRYLRNLER